MFASYVSEASPGCRYVLGARARVSGAGGAGAGAGGATAARVARQRNNTVAPDLLHILSIITHSVQ